MCCRTILAILLTGLALQAAPPASRPFGDSRVVAPVPAPGYPEGIVVVGKKFYVSGPATFGVPTASTIHVYDLESGAFERDIVIANQPADLPRALSCITADNKGDLYVIDVARGIVKIDMKNGVQSVYAGPFTPVFQSAYNAPGAMLPNDLAFDKKGNLYVTDSFQATIWRIPPGGGTPQVWYQDPQVDGIFGPNGLRFDEKGERLYFSVTLNPLGMGFVYSLPAGDKSPTPADLKLFHTYTNGAAPDGMAFGKSGKLYVALAGSSQISVLLPDGTEEGRLSGPAQSAGGGDPLPWANPANIAFNDKDGTLLVTNHASLVPDPAGLFAIFDVVVNDKAAKLF